ncbi:uncharacterized protein A4U43_C05F33110 [Asparagus officinalis]|uniref:Uncharacterized protein n=1 Tax=Asparagus officinalis TaxID=4686 RepID=A0A5P1F0Q9_ASPOF|nr:putative UPF0481 protein At3g02645 [Asparagus officinalis]ONK70379.1 uncharacterized protein A4U43_C05F33110 [Asparagus officinalis]
MALTIPSIFKSCTAKQNKSLSAIPSIRQTPLSNEQEWVIEVQRAIKEDIAGDEDVRAQVSIFCVPQALVLCKPEAYVPQLFALGPYHHWRPQLYDMERYKIAAARRIQGRLNGVVEFDGVVKKFVKKEYKIRCHYHKQLHVNGETLAWMMAIDGSFLLEFLQAIYFKNQPKAQQEAQPRTTLSKRMEHERAKVSFNMIVRDITMLENQIPLFLLRKLFKLVYSQKDIADEELSNILTEFVREVSPFKITVDSLILVMDNFTRHAHLLELLYWTIVPKVKENASEINGVNEQNGTDVESKEEIRGDPTVVQKAMKLLWKILSRINGAPIRYIKRLIFSRPIMFIVKCPWKMITALPVFSLIKLPVKNLFSQPTRKPKSHYDRESDGEEQPPLVEEIDIPSVTELVRAGVKFVPTSKDLTTIRFDAKTVTLYLPIINLDNNTEVVLRNLVAYEASVVTGPMVFTRYAELMYGVIDTEEDVKTLRENGILVNRMKSDGEAAELWNGMSKSVRLTKVGFLDKTIRDVNEYYEGRWSVKCRVLMKKYVYASWSILTFLAAGLLIFLSCVQAFCSVYSCNSRLKQLINSADES